MPAFEICLPRLSFFAGILILLFNPISVGAHEAFVERKSINQQSRGLQSPEFKQRVQLELLLYTSSLLAHELFDRTK